MKPNILCEKMPCNQSLLDLLLPLRCVCMCMSETRCQLAWPWWVDYVRVCAIFVCLLYCTVCLSMSHSGFGFTLSKGRFHPLGDWLCDYKSRWHTYNRQTPACIACQAEHGLVTGLVGPGSRDLLLVLSIQICFKETGNWQGLDLLWRLIQCRCLVHMLLNSSAALLSH